MRVVMNADTVTLSASRMIRRYQITFKLFKSLSPDGFSDFQKTSKESNINISSRKWTCLAHMFSNSLTLVYNRLHSLVLALESCALNVVHFPLVIVYVLCCVKENL